MRQSRNQRATILAAALLLVTSLLGCAAQKPKPVGPNGNAADPVAQEPEVQPFPGYRAPEISATDVRTGRQVKLSALKGQVVLLNFWATWCTPCKAELPAIERFQTEQKGKVTVVALGVDPTEKPEKLMAFAKELGLTADIAYDGGAGALAYRALGVPTSLFIDKQGIIRARHTGEMTYEMIRTYAEETEQLGKK